MPADLTLTEAAAILGLQRHYVWELVKCGRLPARQRQVPGQPRGMWFVARADVDAYAARRGNQLGKVGRTRQKKGED